MSNVADHQYTRLVDDEASGLGQTFAAAWRYFNEFEFILRDSYVPTLLLASGSERALKLTYGFAEQERTGKWPARRFHHDIPAAFSATLEAVGRRRNHVENWPIVGTAIDAARTDDVLAGMLELAAGFARSERYHNIDHLATFDRNQLPDMTTSPSARWRELEALIDAPDDCDPDGPRRERNERFRLAVARLRWLIYQSWAQGAAGQHLLQASVHLRCDKP